MMLMDATAGENDTLELTGMEPAHIAPSSRLHVYAATCTGLTRWGDSLGFSVVLLGVAADPLDAVHGLSVSDHGRGGLLMDEIVADAQPWDDWVLAPLASVGQVDAIEGRAGTLRITLPDRMDAAAFGRRLAVLLAPLEAERLAFTAAAARARCDRGAMPPCSGRFTQMHDGGWVPVAGLYRWSSGRDVSYAYRALAATIGSSAHQDDVLDLLAEGRAAAGGMPD